MAKRQTPAPVVLVTGCSEGGIGNALVRAITARHPLSQVWATARGVDSIGSLPEGGNVHRLALDVTVPKSVKEAVEHVMRVSGRIDILINNAGMGCAGPLAELDLEAARRCYEVNIWGSLAMVQAVVPIMAAQGHGKIVNVGSIVGVVGTPWAGIYSSSKAAVHHLSDVLRLEVEPFGIQVMVVAPGAIKSNMGQNNLANVGGVLARLKLYRPYEPSIQERANASQSSNPTPTDVFARKVVDKIMARQRMPRFFMWGRLSGLFKLLCRLPQAWRDSFLKARMGLTGKKAPSKAAVSSAAEEVRRALLIGQHAKSS